MTETQENAQHLKQVSRIKHLIMQKYLPAWAQILGSKHSKLCYIDCFAGPGRYELLGEDVDGSPVIAVKTAKAFCESRKDKELFALLVEDDEKQRDLLSAELDKLKPFPTNFKLLVESQDSHKLIPNIVKGGKLYPSFFLVDPYGHPLAVPVINEILCSGQTEVLINLMWYRISMDLANPHMEANVDKLFGDEDWRDQPFFSKSGLARKWEFLSYFKQRLKAKYILQFRIAFDPEDNKGKGTKYYLLHASNHIKAVLLMKEVMWPLGDEEGTFSYSASNQQVLISSTPSLDDLKESLAKTFAGKEATFDEIRERTWDLPYIEKHYRQALKELEKSGTVRVTRVASKKIGLKTNDKIKF